MKNTIRSKTSIESTSIATSSKPACWRQIDLQAPLRRAAFLRSTLLKLSSGVLCSILAGSATFAQSSAAKVAAVGPDANAPWPDAQKQGLWPKSAQAVTPQPVPAPKPAAEPAKAPTQPPPESMETSTAPQPVVPQTKPRKHEIAASGDIFFGQGNVTLPVFFALGSPFTPTVLKPDYTSTYYGATISYSYQYAWYVDVSYQHGKSSGSVDLDYSPNFAPLPSDFTIEDNWYQAYIRYAFPSLRGKRLSAYLRVGFSYVDSTMTDSTVFPNGGKYKQTDDTQDYLGNLGFGVGYSLYTTRRLRLGLQLEGEGFFGQRSQQSTETLQNLPGSSTADINNTLYGGIGRATVRCEYRLGQSGAVRVFGDVGLQGKFTQIEYSSVPGYSGQNYSELLWGPYAKLGVRYSF